jgi:Zinc finger, C3HC4 type (RING finger)
MDLLQGQTLSYPGWQEDKKEAEYLYRNYANSDSMARKKLSGMKNKQRLFEGDRTHPDIVALDNTIFTYDGWQEDKKEAEMSHTAGTTLPGCLLIGTVQDKLGRMKKKQTAHSNRSSVAFLRDLDSQTFSYTGWLADKKEAEQFHQTGLSFASTKLLGMKNKQRLFDGDRSHPDIVALDTAIYTYQGWQEDKEKAVQIHTATTIIPGMPIFETVANKFNEMKRKQAMHSNRSSIPFLQQLDSFSFSYTGWQADKDEAEKFYQTSSSFAPKKLIGMKNKQRLFDDDRSHPEIVALDNTIFTYQGWQEDKKKAVQIHTATTLMTGMPVLGTVVDKVNEMKKKQTMHSNRSSDAFLRDLDSVVSVVPRQAQEQQPPPPQQQPSPARRLARIDDCNRHVKRVCSETSRAKAGPVKDDNDETKVNDDDDDAIVQYCVICLEHEPSHAYIPCGHRCICSNCVSEIGHSTTITTTTGELKCPVCRDTAMCITKIFL